LPRNEDEARIKVSQLNTLYNQLVQSSNSLHDNYNKIHLPRVCGALMDALDNSSQVTQRVLERYGELKEKVVMGEATLVSPLEGEGIMEISKIQEIKWDNLDNFLDTDSTRNSISINPIITPRNSLSLNGFGKSSTTFSTCNTLSQFGKSLEEITDLTQAQVPIIIQNCIDYIQSTGLYQEGLYRVSGNSQLITQLKFNLDQNSNLQLEDVVKDIHSVTGVLKLFFREMREPLIPREMFKEFTNAASKYLSNP
jgi:Rho GTPase-activating protein RGD1